MNSTWTQDAYVKAFLYASEAHHGQCIPGTEIAYIRHLSLVAMEVIASFPNEPECDQELSVQCAVLHDIIEDTEVSFEDVAQRFGQAVAEGVQALTKDKTRERSEQMTDSLARIKEQPKAVWRVKLADRICNLLPPPAHWDNEKRRFYQEEARRILEALREASPALSARLQEKIEQYSQYIEG